MIIKISQKLNELQFYLNQIYQHFQTHKLKRNCKMKKVIHLIAFLLVAIVSNAQTDLSALHAPPTQAEIDAVKAEWATRDHSAYNWTVHETGIINGVFTVEIISHEVNGEKHYAAVRYPENYDPMESYPVLISNHGGASGVSAISLGQFQSTCYRSFFVGLPSFRSEEMRCGPISTPPDVIYTSEGTQSEMNGDTDDALALLTGILAIPGADANRVGVLGGSRGGGVSHLMSCKDDRIKRASIFYGATDHMTLPGLQAKMEDYVDNGGGLKPPEAATYTYGVAPYLAGTLTLAEARLELLRRSAIYFIDEMPLPYLVQHGDNDLVVTVNHSQLLEAEFLAAGINPPDFTYIEHAGQGHSLPAATGAPTTQQNFLCELNNIVLDIELTDFQGTCKEQLRQISIEWSAIIGQSASRFDLQWSADARDWTTIKTLDIVENANELANYIYHHTDFKTGENYYRLQETDAAGHVETHRIIGVTCGTDALSLSPNPTTGKVTIALDETVTTSYPEQVVVFDINGRNVFEKQLIGAENEELDLGNLPKGTYSCHFLVKGNWVVERIILM